MFLIATPGSSQRVQCQCQTTADHTAFCPLCGWAEHRKALTKQSKRQTTADHTAFCPLCGWAEHRKALTKQQPGLQTSGQCAGTGRDKGDWLLAPLTEDKGGHKQDCMSGVTRSARWSFVLILFLSCTCGRQSVPSRVPLLHGGKQSALGWSGCRQRFQTLQTHRKSQKLDSLFHCI